MRSIIIEKQGSPVAPNVRFVTDRAEPVAGPGEVRVRTEASALNHLDLWVARGLPGMNTVYPFVGGSDGCGIVESVGAGVDVRLLGRRVLLNAAVPQQQWGHPGERPAGEDLRMIGEHGEGTHREYFTAPATNVLDIGDADPIAAAAVGLTFLTAWRMLRTRAQARAGETVLITGIGGGVALAALSLAKHLGCRVIVTSRAQDKLDRAKQLGADEAVLDDGADWSKAVRALTARRGVDVVIESLGGPIHAACLRAMARGGRLVTCGCTIGATPATDLTRIFWNQLSVLGSTMGSMDEFAEVVHLWRSGRVAPVIDLVVPAREGASAFERLEAGRQFGKLVVDWR